MTRIYAAAALLIMALSFAAGWSWRGLRAEATSNKSALSQAKAETVAQQDARASEHSKADQLATIGEKHEQAREASASVPSSVVADLHSGALKLRDDLARCETQRLSDATASAGQRDASAQLRSEVAGNLVRLARDADDQLRSCQEIVRADRGD